MSSLSVTSSCMQMLKSTCMCDAAVPGVTRRCDIQNGICGVSGVGCVIISRHRMHCILGSRAHILRWRVTLSLAPPRCIMTSDRQGARHGRGARRLRLQSAAASIAQCSGDGRGLVPRQPAFHVLRRCLPPLQDKGVCWPESELHVAAAVSRHQRVWAPDVAASVTVRSLGG